VRKGVGDQKWPNRDLVVKIFASRSGTAACIVFEPAGETETDIGEGEKKERKVVVTGKRGAAIAEASSGLAGKKLVICRYPEVSYLCGPLAGREKKMKKKIVIGAWPETKGDRNDSDRRKFSRRVATRASANWRRC